MTGLLFNVMKLQCLLRECKADISFNIKFSVQNPDKKIYNLTTSI